MPNLRVNGEDIRTLGLRFQGTPGFESMPTRKVVTIDLPGTFGSHLIRVDGGGPKRLSLRMALVSNSVTNRVTLSDAVKAFFSAGLNRVVRELGGTSLVTYGVLDGEPTWETRRTWSDKVTIVTVPLLCPVPLWFSLTGTVIGFTGADASLPLGTGPSALLIRTQGDGSVRIVTVFDAWGLGRRGFSLPSLSTSEYAEIDCGGGSIVKVSSGVRSSIYAQTTISASANPTYPIFPFSIDQTWGDYRQSLWPFYRYSGSNADVLYTKSFF